MSHLDLELVLLETVIDLSRHVGVVLVGRLGLLAARRALGLRDAQHRLLDCAALLILYGRVWGRQAGQGLWAHVAWPTSVRERMVSFVQVQHARAIHQCESSTGNHHDHAIH